jgi:hypothetical protein
VEVREALYPPQGGHYARFDSHTVTRVGELRGGGRSLFGIRPAALGVSRLHGSHGGGTLLLCCVNNRVHAVPYSGQCPVGVAGERVVQVIFLATDTSARVLVETSGSPSSYG